MFWWGVAFEFKLVSGSGLEFRIQVGPSRPKIFCHKTLVYIQTRIRIGSVISNSLDPDPDSAKCVDPNLDSLIPGPKLC
jgi:hypothetical protein